MSAPFGILLLVTLVAGQSAQPPATICVGRPFGFLVADISLCSRYFRCTANGQFTADICRAPTNVFSQQQQRCVAPGNGGNAHCFRCPTQHALIDLPLAGSCSHFARCVAGRPEHLECPRGTLFDAARQSCNAAQQVSCSQAPMVHCPADETAANRRWQRDANDCSVFRVCVNGVATRRQCAPGTQFNTASRMCDLPHNVNCQRQPPPPPPPPTRPFRCAEQRPLPRPIYPHPTDCRRFFVCSGQTAHPQTCPHGTRFDTVQQRCDHWDRAVCAPGARAAAAIDGWATGNGTNCEL